MVMNEQQVSIILSEWELGAGKIGTSAGPKKIIDSIQSIGDQHTNIFTVSTEADNIPHRNTDAAPSLNTQDEVRPNLKNGMALLRHQLAFAQKVSDQLSEGHRCLLLTADHSNGIGGVSGLCKTTDAQTVGVIWIDAHYDLHSPYTTPSGNSHGMAVNALIDDNNTECSEQAVSPQEAQLWEDIKGIKGMGNAIPTQNLVFLGVRDFEPAEAALVEKHGICSIHPQEIERHGITACINKALSHLAHCEHLYVSFDVDSMDPSISIATGTPVKGGLTLEEAKTVVKSLLSDSRTRCLEITEYNPTLPQPEEMLSAVREILWVSGLI